MNAGLANSTACIARQFHAMCVGRALPAQHPILCALSLSAPSTTPYSCVSPKWQERTGRRVRSMECRVQRWGAPHLHQPDDALRPDTGRLLPQQQTIHLQAICGAQIWSLPVIPRVSAPGWAAMGPCPKRSS